MSEFYAANLKQPFLILFEGNVNQDCGRCAEMCVVLKASKIYQNPDPVISQRPLQSTNCHSIIKLQIQALIPRGPACCEKWYDIVLQPRVFWSWDPTNKLQTNQSRARFPEKNKNKNILLLVFAPASPTSSPPLWTIPPSSSCCRSRSSLLSPGCWWWSGLHGSRHRGHNGCHLKILQSIWHQAILVHLLQEYAMCVFMIYTRILVPYTSTVYCKQYVYIIYIYIYILIVIYNVINVVM